MSPIVPHLAAIKPAFLAPWQFLTRTDINSQFQCRGSDKESGRLFVHRFRGFLISCWHPADALECQLRDDFARSNA